MTEVTKNVTEVAKKFCGAKNMTEVTENVTEVTKNITEVTKHGFGTKSMDVNGRVWLLLPCIAVYRSILQYIAVFCSISQYIVVHCSISHFLAVIDPNSFGLVLCHFMFILLKNLELHELRFLVTPL